MLHARGLDVVEMAQGVGQLVVRDGVQLPLLLEDVRFVLRGRWKGTL